MSLGVLVSGYLGCIVLKHLFKRHKVNFVMTDKKSTSIIEFCKINKLEIFVANPRNGVAFEFLSSQKIEVLLSVNYLFLIEKDLIELPSKIAFNIHGSLLPKYRGRTPHVWAIINNETQTGVTAHLIDEGCDTGDIIEQVIVKIDKDDSGNDLLQKYNNLYVPLLDSVLTKIETDTLRLIVQNNNLATYFGKRTPQDGKIDWNWHRERIMNWVRAQSFPYPGAFTFYNDEKIVIDNIEFTDDGFSQETPNGTILSVLPTIIKTPNGAVVLKNIRTGKTNFEKLKVFK
jgi:methionyl-tRNA formyltransferase